MKTIVVAAVMLGAACSSAPVRDPLAGSRQAIVVTTTGWDATQGTLQRYSRIRGTWQSIGEPVEIVLGRSGLAWAGGLLAQPAPAGAPLKREGDGKSPAGIFALGTAFGFAPTTDFHMPYRQLRETTECVDDVASLAYNRVVDRDAVGRVDWSSSEKMRSIDQYRWGAVVEHNTPPKPGGGSCIFLHIWSGPSSTTAGCTAMRQEDLLAILRWLNPEANPRLIQMPKDQYAQRNPLGV